MRERKILGVSARGEMLRRTGQQREQSAAAGLGPGCAAREAGRNRGAGERFFEIRHVTSRRVQRDRHTVEGDATRRLGKNPARNLDALLHLARRRDDLDRIVERALGRCLVAEEVILKPRDRFRRRGCTGRGRRRDAESRGEHRERDRVALRHGREHRGRARRERRVQFALERRADRDVEHQDRHRGVARRRIGTNDRGRQREHRRAVDQARVVKLGLELTQHRGKRRADPLQRCQLVRANSCKADLAQRAGERARKSGTVGQPGRNSPARRRRRVCKSHARPPPRRRVRQPARGRHETDARRRARRAGASGSSDERRRARAARSKRARDRRRLVGAPPAPSPRRMAQAPGAIARPRRDDRPRAASIRLYGVEASWRATALGAAPSSNRLPPKRTPQARRCGFMNSAQEIQDGVISIW